MNAIIESINLMLSQDVIKALIPIKPNYTNKQFAFSNSMGYTVYFANALTYVTIGNKMYRCETTPKNKPQSIESIIIESGN